MTFRLFTIGPPSGAQEKNILKFRAYYGIYKKTLKYVRPASLIYLKKIVTKTKPHFGLLWPAMNAGSTDR